MSFSQATLIQRVRDLVQDFPWAQQLATSPDNSTTSITVPDGTLWSSTGGDILEFQDTGEQCLVTSVSGNVLTVIRAYNGTAAAAHTTPLVWKNPTFGYHRTQDSIELITQSLWPYAWKKVVTAITPVANQVWYNLASDAMALINVSQVDTSVTPNRYYIYGARGSHMPVGMKFNLPTALAASTVGIQFPRGFFTLAFNVEVSYAAALTAAVSAGNYSDISDGILAELIAHGAAARLLHSSEIPRDTQTDVTLGDSSVVPGSRTRLAIDLQQQFLIKRNIYFEQLRRTMPFVGQRGGGASATASTAYSGVPYP